MKIALRPTKDWQLGALRFDVDVTIAIDAPANAAFRTIITNDGWPITIAEFCDTDTAYFLATIELIGETASIRAQCPLEHAATSRSRFIELLQTARPAWPETILLSDLLALPATA